MACQRLLLRRASVQQGFDVALGKPFLLKTVSLVIERPEHIGMDSLPHDATEDDDGHGGQSGDGNQGMVMRPGVEKNEQRPENTRHHVHAKPAARPASRGAESFSNRIHEHEEGHQEAQPAGHMARVRVAEWRGRADAELGLEAQRAGDRRGHQRANRQDATRQARRAHHFLYCSTPLSPPAWQRRQSANRPGPWMPVAFALRSRTVALSITCDVGRPALSARWQSRQDVAPVARKMRSLWGFTSERSALATRMSGNG